MYIYIYVVYIYIQYIYIYIVCIYIYIYIYNTDYVDKSSYYRLSPVEVYEIGFTPGNGLM